MVVECLEYRQKLCVILVVWFLYCTILWYCCNVMNCILLGSKLLVSLLFYKTALQFINLFHNAVSATSVKWDIIERFLFLMMNWEGSWKKLTWHSIQYCHRILRSVGKWWRWRQHVPLNVGTCRPKLDGVTSQTTVISSHEIFIRRTVPDMAFITVASRMQHCYPSRLHMFCVCI
jgi:hypothetical protein